ncbi:MAG: PQQ-dependent sugar dehydrogenase, partial [Myxococcales bacterium]|nr:PQQ-dependent sugar dehydrogenase [Myxococcales bacterium]
MKKLTFAATLGLLGLFTRTALAAPGDTLSAGDPDDLFTITDYVASDTALITTIRFLPDGRMLIGEKTGALKIREANGTIRTLYTFPVTTTSEQGLLGVAVQPDFATSRRIVVYWTRANSVGGTPENRINVSSFKLNPDDTVDFASEKVLVANITAPANHDGGGLSFGPDGYLYVGVGDNGCNESVPATGLHRNLRGTAMNVATGKVLRVAVDGSIPPTNPFVNATGAITGKPLPSGECVREASATLPTTT